MRDKTLSHPDILPPVFFEQQPDPLIAGCQEHHLGVYAMVLGGIPGDGIKECCTAPADIPFLVGAFKDALEFLPAVFCNCSIKVFFSREVLVECRFGHSQGACDLVHGRLVVAFVQEEIVCYFYDLLPDLFLISGYNAGHARAAGSCAPA